MNTSMMSTSESLPAPTELPTRERILYEAAQLFARQGYHGTTTREIAEAVGIRQPSLFHHFATKGAMVEALLAWDLGLALPRVHDIARQPESPAVRLYRYLRVDVTHLATAPYNLSGVYTEEVIGSPEFAPWARRRSELHDVVEEIVREGMDSGTFVRLDPNMIRQAIGGILVRVITMYSGGRGTVDALADEVARLLVRGLLVDPDRIDDIAQRATTSPG
jgi:AcrR family transcriptional regulator